MNNNKNLFELLREKRNQIAKENNIKPFVVLHNSVLREVAKIKPFDLENKELKVREIRLLNRSGKIEYSATPFEL